MESDHLDLPQEVFEPVIAQPMEIEELGRELLICFNDLDGPCEIRTCYGDIRKIVDSLMDYARLLEMVCEQWDLKGFHQASYMSRAMELRKIARKYQAGIHYDYDAAVEKCRRKQAKKQRDDDVGGEAIEMTFLRSLRESAKKQSADKSQRKKEAIRSRKGNPSSK